MKQHCARQGRARRRLSRLASYLSIAMMTPWICACARPVQVEPPGRPADVDIIDRGTGERLPVYEHGGERWVAGVPGHRYAIRVRNRASTRLLAVMSVDGLNVLSGEPAAWQQRGYVFAAGAQYDVAGWRKSNDRIAAFEFGSVPDSYASRIGRPDNIGVIGVALFREAAPVAAQVAPEAAEDRAARAAPSPAARSGDAQGQSPGGNASGPMDSIGELSRARPASSERAESALSKSTLRAPSLGTGHGRSETSIVELTEFERAQATPDQVITIRYDRYEALVAMGIIALPPSPKAFPDSTAAYVPDPPPR
jgi:hypothetical protein